jgi:hypothetical protein
VRSSMRLHGPADHRSHPGRTERLPSDEPQNDASSTNKNFVHKRDNIVIYVDCVP